MEKDLSKPDMPKEDWGYYEDEFGDEEPPDKSDQSDDDFEDYSSKKKKGKGKATKAKGVSEIHRCRLSLLEGVGGTWLPILHHYHEFPRRLNAI